MINLLTHPFVKLPRVRISNKQKILVGRVFTVSPEMTNQELLPQMKPELSK